MSLGSLEGGKDISDRPLEYASDMVLARVVSVVGYKDSGKTRVVEGLVGELAGRGYRVGTLKHTAENVLLDTPGKDTWRHREAGSGATGILHGRGSAFFFDGRLTVAEAVSMLGGVDFVVTEGFKSLGGVARIVVPREAGEVGVLSNGLEVALVDIGGRGIPALGGVPVIPLEGVSELADVVEGRAFPVLPGLDCGDCGYGGCSAFGGALLEGEVPVEDCVGFSGGFSLRVDGGRVAVRGFVRDIMRNVIMGVVRTLKGVGSPGRVEVCFEVDGDG
jgi:molybdopterin-guanine dinucleotide biosynthesis protein B